MILNLFWKTLREQRTAIFSYAVALVAFAVMLVYLWPDFEADIHEIMDIYPEGFIQFFSGIETVDMTTFEGFLTIEIFSLMWPVLIGAFVIAFASAAIAKEVETGTMELLLSQPISRAKVLLAKILVMVLGITLISLATTAGIYLTAFLVDVDIEVRGLAMITVLGIVFFSAVGSYSLLFSSFLSERGRAAFISAGILAVSYLISALAAFSETIETISYISLFRYYRPYKVLSEGAIPWSDAGIFLGIIVVSLTGAFLLFKYRDIAP